MPKLLSILRDITYKSVDPFSIGAVIAAQGVFRTVFIHSDVCGKLY